MTSLASFFFKYVAHRPPDGLVVEWMCNSVVPTAYIQTNNSIYLFELIGFFFIERIARFHSGI